jgi:hypothetical protein
VTHGAGAPITGFQDDGTPIREPIPETRQKRHGEVISAMETRAKIRQLTGEANFENQTVMVRPVSLIVAMADEIEATLDECKPDFQAMAGMSVDNYRDMFVTYFMGLAEDSVNYEWEGHLHGSEQYVVDSLGLKGIADDATRRAILENVSTEFLLTTTPSTATTTEPATHPGYRTVYG